MALEEDVHTDPSPGSGASVARRRAVGHRSLWLWRVAVVVVVAVLWQTAYHFELGSRALLPSPAAVWEATLSLHRSGALWTNLLSTAEATLAALLLAAVVGIPLGILLGMLQRTWAVCAPFLNALNSMPRIALAPLFIVLFGVGQSAKIALGFSAAVFVFIMNARIGVLSADEDHRKACVMLGASRYQLVRKLYLPTAVPAIFTAFRLGTVYALLGVVSSEIIASREGVGQLITTFSATLTMASVYSLLIILAVFAAVLTIIAGVLETKLLRWKHVSASM